MSPTLYFFMFSRFILYLWEARKSAALAISSGSPMVPRDTRDRVRDFTQKCSVAKPKAGKTGKKCDSRYIHMKSIYNCISYIFRFPPWTPGFSIQLRLQIIQFQKYSKLRETFLYFTFQKYKVISIAIFPNNRFVSGICMYYVLSHVPS